MYYCFHCHTYIGSADMEGVCLSNGIYVQVCPYCGHNKVIKHD
jgi:DNA-directed RNA polymerase subunit RPC12/RpoP